MAYSLCSLAAAQRTITRYDALAMIRKGQVRNIGGQDMTGQAGLIARLFQIAA